MECLSYTTNLPPQLLRSSRPVSNSPFEKERTFLASNPRFGIGAGALFLGIGAVMALFFERHIGILMMILPVTFVPLALNLPDRAVYIAGIIGFTVLAVISVVAPFKDIDDPFVRLILIATPAIYWAYRYWPAFEPRK
jgi:hypothetical protein